MTGRITIALLALAWVFPSAAEEPVYATRSPSKTPLIEEIREKIRPLQHERGKRWPMILWEAVSFDPQPAEVYRDLLDRGLTQHIRMDENDIPTAKALQAAGSPVIMMQGAGGPWPASLAGDPSKWAHQFEPGFKPNGEVRSCPAMRDGWRIQADRVRATLHRFKDAGVTVDAVWMDWEGDPLGGSAFYDQASHCKRCRETLPPWTLASKENFGAYCWRLYLELIGAYVAAPAREVFPRCSVTNWQITLSTEEKPILSWSGVPFPPAIPNGLTATNPVAYGNTICFAMYQRGWPRDREHVDQFYTWLLLQQVSNDTANRLRFAPQLQSIPWIARWCPDDENPKIPIMSRERYREALRHLWLRGVDGMQIFNASRKGYEKLTFTEIEDAVAVYDEMLAYREFLDDGQVLCTNLPEPQDHDAIWSGVRWKEYAIIRAFKPGGETARFVVEPWPGKIVELEATPTGRTYRLKNAKDGVQVNVD
jgi:hypothetical protein